jgi:hypothetical protein
LKVRSLAGILSALLLAACTSPTPALVPTATPQPIPTLSPATDTPAPSLTSTAPALATVAPSTLTPALAPTTVGLCSNPFRPVSPSAHWQYRATGFASTTPVTYTVTLSNLTDNSFIEHYALQDAAFDVQWQCSNEGLRAAPAANVFVSGQMPFQLDAVTSSGVTLAPADRWSTGATWSSAYDVRGQATLNGMTVTGTGTVNIQDQVLDQEQVTVPAGTFQAWRVDSTIRISLTGSSGGTSVPVVFSFTRSSWYASNAGLVKMVLNLDSQPATTELVAFTP